MVALVLSKNNTDGIGKRKSEKMFSLAHHTKQTILNPKNSSLVMFELNFENPATSSIYSHSSTEYHRIASHKTVNPN